MKRSKKMHIEALPLLIALTIVAVVFGVIFVQTQKTQQTKSKASFEPVALCTKYCNTIQIPSMKATCSTRCTDVTDGTMSCSDFCKGISAGATAQKICMTRCGQFTSPCTSARGVCSYAKSNQSECQNACETVQTDLATCDEVFASGVYTPVAQAQNQVLSLIRSQCKRLLE